jgi:hypothetical protein
MEIKLVKLCYVRTKVFHICCTIIVVHLLNFGGKKCAFIQQQLLNSFFVFYKT